MCQKIVSELESYYLSYILDNAKEWSIGELVERNTNLEITRKWEFNSDGKILTEIDYRESFSSLYEGEILKNESKASQKSYLYIYGKNGNLEKIIERRIVDDKQKENEYIIINNDENLYSEEMILINTESRKTSFRSTTKFSNGKIDTIYHYYSNIIGKSKLESVVKSKYNYNAAGQLLSKVTYSQSFGSPKDYFQNENSEILSKKCIYHYDQENKLKELIEYIFDENGNKEIDRNIIFKYDRNESKPNEIKVNHGKAYSPKIIQYKIKYDLNGMINEIKINGDRFSYKIKKIKLH